MLNLATLHRLMSLIMDVLSQLGIRSILAAWRLLTGVLTRSRRPSSSYSRVRKLAIGDSCHSAPLDNSGFTGTIVHCASKVPSTLASGPIVPYTLIDLNQNSLCHQESEELEEEAGPLSLAKTIPSMSLRYRRTRIVSTHQLSFNPRLTLFPTYQDASNPEIPSLFDWDQHIHPEGQIYYYNPVHHVVTEANLRSPKILGRIKFWIKQFYILKEKSCLELPNAYELLLELDLEEEGCSYYLVDHDLRTTFYFDDADTACLGLPDVCSTDHLKLLLEEQYWIHMEYFPMHKSLPASAQSTIIGILTHAWGDQSTSSLSTAPYNAEKCKEFINMIEKLTGTYLMGWRGGVYDSGVACGPEQEGYKTCIVSRLMNEFTHSRFINLYGQADGARLARNQSTLSEDERDPPVCGRIRASFTVLLWQPYKELEELKSLWVDHIVYTEHWRKFISTRTQEWRSVSLMSSILLLVDATLVIHLSPEALNSGWLNQSTWAGTGHLAGTVSLLLSLSTMVVGITAILVHQPHCDGHASDANAYLQNASHERYGLQPLAIVLSLPRTLFLWALATAGVALVTFSLQQLLNVWSMGVVGSIAVLLGALLLWVLRFFHIRESGCESGLGMFSSLPLFAFPQLKFFRHKNAEQDALAESA